LGERNHPVVIAVAVLACHAVRNDPLLTDDVSGKRETFVRVHVLLKETLTATTSWMAPVESLPEVRRNWL